MLQKITPKMSSDLPIRVLVKSGKYPVIHDNVNDDYEVTTEDTEEVLATFQTFDEALNFIKECL